jgi:hypothetical protein
MRVLTDASTETVLGLAGLAAAVLLAASGGGIVTGLAIGLGVQAMTYLTAPAVTIAADRSLARATSTLLDPGFGRRPARPGASAASPRPGPAIAPRAGDTLGQARALERLGQAHLQDGNSSHGLACLRHALTIYQLLGAPGARRIQDALRYHELTSMASAPGHWAA